MRDRLTRSTDDVIIAGVAGGMAEYFDVDVVIVRLVFVLLLISSAGTFGFLYLALMVILPEVRETEHGVRPTPPSPPPPGPPVAGGDVPAASPGGLESSEWQPSTPEAHPWQPSTQDRHRDAPSETEMSDSEADAATETGPSSSADAWQTRVERSVERAAGDAESPSTPTGAAEPSAPDRRAQFALLLIIAGILLLFDIDFDFSWIAPVIIIGLGLYLLVKRGRGS